jgi:tetratricopeptide (TPR) repeat protein
MLGAWVASGRRGLAERLGRHLLLAGDTEAALEPLLRGARERRETSDYRIAHALLDRREEALASLGTAETDPRWGEGWVLRARILLHEARLDDVFRWAERAADAALRHAWWTIRAEALRLLGDAARRRGDLARARQLYESCIALRDAVDTPHGVAGSLWGLGDVARQQGRLEEALQSFETSRALYEQIGDAHGIADHAIGCADVAWQRRDVKAAARLYRDAQLSFESLGNRYGVARSWNGLGEVARQQGLLSEAEDDYRRALSILEVIRSAEALFPRVNLGLVALSAGRHNEALAWLAEAGRDLEGMAWHGLAACVDAALAACAARERDWATYRARVSRASASAAASGLCEPDLATCAETAGDLAWVCGERAHARDAYRLALAQWTQLGHVERAGHVKAALDRL